MIDSNTLNDLAKRLADAMPGDLRLLAGDMEKTFQGILQATFSRMNLVSREEFDVQRGVLERTRERLESLETRVAELEKQYPDH
ncbi:MAG: ubiquinone biosynthesis accessory factor UbiK [Methylococcus sp.]